MNNFNSVASSFNKKNTSIECQLCCELIRIIPIFRIDGARNNSVSVYGRRCPRENCTFSMCYRCVLALRPPDFPCPACRVSWLEACKIPDSIVSYLTVQQNRICDVEREVLTLETANIMLRDNERSLLEEYVNGTRSRARMTDEEEDDDDDDDDTVINRQYSTRSRDRQVEFDASDLIVFIRNSLSE